YPIAVVQYERADYSVGNEEHLHWALIVITNEGDLTGPCWQVVDRHYSDGRGVVWELFDGNEVRLKMTKKCLGGVKIGTVKDKDLEFFATVSAQSQAPVPKFEGWNCRDWVIEAIGHLALAQKGWIATGGVPDQAALLPALKRASAQT
ncbi:uncharacterized protein STEHIDRAFT_26097, partial [Stereum hirsutum FP-91666 SS1]